MPYEEPALAAEEIDRAATHPGFVQVLLLVRTDEPLGRRRYRPIFEAAVRNGLPVGIHFGGGRGRNPLTGSGWPSFYIEHHTAMALAFQSQVVSLARRRDPALPVARLGVRPDHRPLVVRSGAHAGARL